MRSSMVHNFFFQAEDGIRDKLVTGVQTCALPISTVLCLVTPRDCLRVFSVSKFATNRVTPFNSGVWLSSFSKGACARQVGHQSAWNTTATGLPAASIESYCA